MHLFIIICIFASICIKKCMIETDYKAYDKRITKYYEEP